MYNGSFTEAGTKLAADVLLTKADGTSYGPPFDVTVTNFPAGPNTVSGGGVTASTISAAIFSNNPSRKKFIIVNDANAILYVRYGLDPATSNDYSIRIAANDYYESAIGDFTGPMQGVWASTLVGSGEAKVTEIS